MQKLWSVLTFTFTRNDCLTFSRREFFVGLTITWLVGIGRYWDHPHAKLAQYLGLGSVAYIFLLSFFIWLIVYPIRKKHWQYFQVLTFVSLVSLPAILYAIPVERFMSLATARSTNVLFLQVVALWRVALLVVFLKRYAQLTVIETIVATLLPLTFIVASLTALNLERAVFNIMAGIQENSGTPYDSAYFFLFALTSASVFLLPFLLVLYGLLIFRAHRSRNTKKT